MSKAPQEYIDKIKERGFEYGGDLIPENLEGSNRIVRVNLPETKSGFIRGNGEGCWAYILDDEDVEKYDKGEEKFKVALMNHSVYYPGLLAWGTIIQVIGRGDNRPVMDIDWFKEITSIELE